MKQPKKSENTSGYALIALGSNAMSRNRSPRDIVQQAIDALDRAPLSLVRKSRLYLTPFVPVGGGPDVVNAVVLVETGLSAQALLAHLHDIEADFDRTREERWTSRTLDLDLIMMGDMLFPDPEVVRSWIALPPDEQRRHAPDELVLPHPRLQDRAFVLVPAAEVAPDWRHPLLNKTIGEMLAALPADEVAAVTPLDA